MNYNETYSKGENLYYKGNYEGALSYFKSALLMLENDKYKCNKENHLKKEEMDNCKNYIGCCYIKLNLFDKAKKIFFELINNTDWERPLFNLARIYIYDNNFVEAEKCIKKALAINPHSSDAHFYYGVLYVAKKQYHRAIDEYQKSIALDINLTDEELSDVYKNIAECYELLNMYEENIIYLNKALKGAENKNKIFYEAAHSFFRLKDYETAKKLLKRIVTSNEKELELIQEKINLCESLIH